ncbi:Molecular chaperone IbpA, HSP20 family [Andreprevotia lacus DSM 23236]|jgi:HSP20 family molecular chaperone IbpA|uniref:Molecular chaperone IbpA, HSP20 family n=1 Tax=Andreprevotia lacus DSM 23236 TaxID=1121001 RepID=A0A1W1Y2D5_9NEIS|nr:DUF3304 domain-containing protein [Andreprevotia lacus]SMC29951.1 Molecular chaperone IbpA, HSP20 family [Andreprevotia lacus DSM 23236]
MKNRHMACCALLLAALLGACDQKPKRVGVPTHTLNWTDNDVARVMIGPIDGGQPSSAPNEGPVMPGVIPPVGFQVESCCADIPLEWHPGLQTTVRWLRDNMAFDKRDRSGVEWLTATVQISPWKKSGGDLMVVILPDDKIKVVVAEPGIDWDSLKVRPATNDPYVVKGTVILDLTRDELWRVQSWETYKRKHNLPADIDARLDQAASAVKEAQ